MKPTPEEVERMIGGCVTAFTLGLVKAIELRWNGDEVALNIEPLAPVERVSFLATEPRPTG